MRRQQLVDRDRVRQLFGQGLTAQQIAYRLRCSESVVNKIRREIEGGAAK